MRGSLLPGDSRRDDATELVGECARGGLLPGDSRSNGAEGRCSSIPERFPDECWCGAVLPEWHLVDMPTAQS
eukprot:2661291-Rhodomonas_salina.1